MFRHAPLEVPMPAGLVIRPHLSVIEVVPDKGRIAELELRLMAQDDLIEQLHEEVLQANGALAVMAKRLARVEQQLQAVCHAVDPPADEKPPHY